MVIAEKGGGRGRVAKSRCDQGNAADGDGGRGGGGGGGEGEGERVEECSQAGEASRVEMSRASSTGGEEPAPWTGGGGARGCSGSRESPGSVTVRGGVGEASGAGVGGGSADSPSADVSDDVGICADSRWIPAAGEEEDSHEYLHTQEVARGGEGRERGDESEVEMQEVVGWIRSREPETQLNAPD